MAVFMMKPVCDWVFLLRNTEKMRAGVFFEQWPDHGLTDAVAGAGHA
jgi:hypothetical protein